MSTPPSFEPASNLKVMTPSVKVCTATLVVVLFMQGAGCKRPAEKQSDPSARAREQIYSRTETVFQDAVFYKPKEDGAPSRTFDLAPLIVQAVDSEPGTISRADRMAAVGWDARTGLTLNTERPTIYTDDSVAVIHGRDHDQAVYVWWYGPRRKTGADHAHEEKTAWCGYRITLDGDGFPIVWEVFGSHGDMVMLYVSKSLEAAAGKAFGPPLPGRRFSIEPSVDERSNVVVARVLDDGPVPMGPFVYMLADSRGVATLICRCMPSQVRNFVENDYYDLLPLSRLGNGGVGRPPAEAGWPCRAAELPHAQDALSDPAWLERALRWPESF